MTDKLRVLFTAPGLDNGEYKAIMATVVRLAKRSIGVLSNGE